MLVSRGERVSVKRDVNKAETVLGNMKMEAKRESAV
jgi:hypothetical protein